METPTAAPVVDPSGTNDAEYPAWEAGEQFAESAAATPPAAEDPEGAPAPSAAPGAPTAPPVQTDPATAAQLAHLQAERDHLAQQAQAAEARERQWQQAVAQAALLDEQNRYAQLDQRWQQGMDPDDYRRERAAIDQRRGVREGIAAQAQNAQVQAIVAQAQESIQVAQATAIENARVAWIELHARENGLSDQDKRRLYKLREPDDVPEEARLMASGRASSSAQAQAQQRQTERADVVGGGGSGGIAPTVDYASLDYYASIPWQRR